MALYCPACGEQIYSRRAGICAGCRRELPGMLRLNDGARKLMDAEHERARRAAHSGNSGGGADGGFGWADSGCDGGGDSGGD